MYASSKSPDGSPVLSVFQVSKYRLNVYRLEMTAPVKSSVDALPPISIVRTLPELMTSYVAVAMLLAIESRLNGGLPVSVAESGSGI